MARQRRDKPQWELHVRGGQREALEADLLAQIVVMLGRQLSQETMTDEKTSQPTDEEASS